VSRELVSRRAIIAGFPREHRSRNDRETIAKLLGLGSELTNVESANVRADWKANSAPSTRLIAGLDRDLRRIINETESPRARSLRELRIKLLSGGCKYDDVTRHVPFREVLIIISHPSGRRANILERAIT